MSEQVLPYREVTEEEVEILGLSNEEILNLGEEEEIPTDDKLEAELRKFAQEEWENTHDAQILGDSFSGLDW